MKRAQQLPIQCEFKCAYAMTSKPMVETKGLYYKGTNMESSKTTIGYNMLSFH